MRQYLRTLDQGWYALADRAAKWSRDFLCYWGRRKGYWQDKWTAVNGPGEYVYFGPGEQGTIGHALEDHQGRNQDSTHAHLSSLGDSWHWSADRRCKDAIDNILNFYDQRLEILYNLERPTQQLNSSVGVGFTEERSPAWDLLLLNEAYRVTGDIDQHNNAARIIEFLLKWIKHEENAAGGFKQGTHTIGAQPVNDPRTGSPVLDWHTGTSYWCMHNGQDNNFLQQQGFSNGCNPWMCGMLFKSIVDWYDHDVALDNISTINHIDVREMLYQAARYIQHFGWHQPAGTNIADGYWLYTEAHSEPSNGRAEGALLYGLARIYGLWHADRTANTLLHPLHYYDNMSQVKNIIDQRYASYETRKAPLQSNGFFGYEVYGHFEFISAMNRVVWLDGEIPAEGEVDTDEPVVITDTEQNNLFAFIPHGGVIVITDPHQEYGVRKDPDASLYYWVSLHALIYNKIINTVELIVDPGITIDAPQLNAQAVTDHAGVKHKARSVIAWSASGGEDGKRYRVTIRYTLNTGEQDDQSIMIDVSNH